MKICGQKIKVTLHGREMTFSEQELIAVLEKNFPIVTEQVSTAKVVQVPTEGILFEVNLQAINKKLFQTKRSDQRQEKTRQLIQEAFAEASKYPEKYASPFYTMVPEMDWSGYKAVTELKKYANDLGGMMADWVEQALEWAQRINNGESWKDICNNVDTSKCSRMIVWKNGRYRNVGNSCSLVKHNRSASFVLDYDYCSDVYVYCTVPLVVFKKK